MQRARCWWAGCAAVLVVSCGAGQESEEDPGTAEHVESRDSAPVFARSFGLTDDAKIEGFARGRGGQIAVAGRARGPQGIGAGAPVSPRPDTGVFVLGFGSDGQSRFSRFFPEASFGAVAVDDAGDTLVTGETRRAATFGEIVGREKGAYVVRLDPEGNIRWVHMFPGRRAAGHAIAVDAAGNVIFGGKFGREITIGPDHLSGPDELFVARLRPSGDVVWSKSFWGEPPHDLTQIAIDASGRAVIAGTFSDRLGRDLHSNGGTDVFVAAIEPDGQTAWARSYGGRGDDDPPHLALAPDGSVITAGAFTGTLDPGSGPIAARDKKRSGYVAAFAPDGRPRWAKPLTVGAQPSVSAVAVAPSGGIMIAGKSAESGEAMPFLAALDDKGQLLKLTMLPVEGTAWIQGLAFDPSGSMILAGGLGRSIALGGTIVRGDRPQNFFLARIAP